MPESDELKAVDTLGVDFGIVNLTVDSDDETHSGEVVRKVRGKAAKLRSALQSCGTRSAKKHLKKLAGTERRSQRDTNHCISKHIVEKAKDTNRAIVLEDLEGIRSRKAVTKARRRDLHAWSFFQLRSFIKYKAKLAGVPVVIVDPRNTSRTCPACGHVDASNRKTREDFECVRCGFADLADRTAAINKSARGRVNGPNVAMCLFDHVGPPQSQARESIRG